MPVTADTLAAALASRVTVNRHVDATVAALTVAWARGWNELTHDWQLAVAQVLEAGTTGRLTTAQLFRLTRVRHALAVSLDALEDLAAQAGHLTIDRIPALVGDAADHEARLILSQIPDVPDLPVTDIVGRAVEAISKRATEQVTSLLKPLSQDAYQVMLAEVQRGVALGVNPRVAGRRMLQRTRGGFDGGLSRATRIARTEMLDAYRVAAHEVDQTNTELLAGWRWSASLSPRTCPACLSMSGQVFPTSTPGPHGHVNCRCARMPVAKSWADLGIVGLDEPADVFPDARAWFDALPRTKQLEIMGPTRLRLLESGEASWDDLAVKVHNPNWRPSYQPRTLTDLGARATRTG